MTELPLEQLAAVVVATLFGVMAIAIKWLSEGKKRAEFKAADEAIKRMGAEARYEIKSKNLDELTRLGNDRDAANDRKK